MRSVLSALDDFAQKALRRKKSCVFVMRADPAPKNAAVDILAESAIAAAYAHGPVASRLLQVQRRMTRIAFQQLVVLTGETLDFFRKLAEAIPEVGAGEVLQISRLLPAR